ncbi:MAG: hypothetical protein U0325_12110 [Polyangiales bacterium]
MSDGEETPRDRRAPMLNACSHQQDRRRRVAVVTRYFGGTLPGRGGLVQAYTGGVVEALAGVPTQELGAARAVAIEDG